MTIHETAGFFSQQLPFKVFFPAVFETIDLLNTVIIETKGSLLCAESSDIQETNKLPKSLWMV